MSTGEVLMEGIVFGESPRWHDGRLWFSDWGANQVIALNGDGSHEVVAAVPSFPMCIDFLPDGRLLVVDSARRRLLRRDADGTLVPHADLSALADKPWNEVVTDRQGNAYVNTIGFEFPGGEFAPGQIALVTPDGRARPVAGDLAFPNGMAITPDGATLIVAESHASRLTAYDIGPGGDLSGRRTWADTPGDHPDGICLDAEAAWYADVGNQHCVRVREGGRVLATVDLDRGAFACVLSRGPDPRLFVVGQQYGGPGTGQAPTGQVVAFSAPRPGVGKP